MDDATAAWESFGFAAEHDRPIPYMQRIRDYYVGLGYGAPYRWAHYAEVPFQPLRKPLAESSLALIVTAAPYQPDKGDQGPGAPYNSAAKFYKAYSAATDREHDLRISHIGYDRTHTSATDSNVWFPLPALRRAVAAGRVGRLTPSFHGAPTNRSHRTTLDVDCPDLLDRCRAEGADVAVLVPNCPVCHQTVSLVARHLEANGIPTVAMACARDIVEYVGVPRLLFSDFPLGNAAGRPHDVASQDATLELALATLEGAPAPRTTVQSPLRWADNPDWKLDYSNIERLSAEEIRRRREEFDVQKRIAADKRKVELTGNAA